MTTTTASASCTENIRLVREMLKTVKPNDLTDDEIVAMVEILRAAADRKQETRPAWCTSIWCDPASARGLKRMISVPSARHQPPWWWADSTPCARLPEGTGRVLQLRRTTLRHTPALLTSTSGGGLRFACSSNFLCAARRPIARHGRRPHAAPTERVSH
jgi:hypothetical protein